MRARALAKVFLVLIVAIPIPFTFAKIYFDTENVAYRTSLSEGIIYLEKPFYATEATRINNFLMFSSFDYGSSVWVVIGFSCQTESANMTINKVENKLITYTVDAPTSTVSHTKIYCGNKRKPKSVIGATSWKYNGVNKTLFVTVVHSSPQQIIVDWRKPSPSKVVFGSLLSGYETVALIPFILVCAAFFGAMNGSMDIDLVWTVIKISLIIMASTLVIASLLSAFG